MMIVEKTYSWGFLGNLRVAWELPPTYRVGDAIIGVRTGPKTVAFNLEILPDVAPVLLRFFKDDPMNMVLFCATFALV